MVCRVHSLDCLVILTKDRKIELENEFILRRSLAEKMLFDKNYFRCFNYNDLPNQALMINGLIIEASRLDDEYRAFTGKDVSDPNYEQLQYMYHGVKSKIRREIRYRD